MRESDREAFFNAMETLYRLPTKEGNHRYGDEYKVGGRTVVVVQFLDLRDSCACDMSHLKCAIAL